MSRYDYERSRVISAIESFYAIIMAAMRGADDINLPKLKQCWPDVWDELRARYNAPGGIIEGDPDFKTLKQEDERITKENEEYPVK